MDYMYISRDQAPSDINYAINWMQMNQASLLNYGQPTNASPRNPSKMEILALNY